MVDSRENEDYPVAVCPRLLAVSPSVATPSLCIFCSQAETIEHALLFCQFANKVWQQLKGDFEVHLRRHFFTSPRTWTLDFLGRCSKIEATVVMVAMWHIWDARNKAREGDGLLHPHAVATKVKVYVDMIIQHLYKPAPTHICESSSSRLKWTPPPAGLC